MNETCFLVLEDGTVFKGRSFGAFPPKAHELVSGSVDEKAAGEVVFNTGMTGYYEILTDPSYTGQIVTMTYPLIGNYGTDPAWSEIGPEDSDFPKIKPAGFIARKVYQGPLPEGRKDLSETLAAHDTPGIWDIDTRMLTLKIRDEGSPRGVIVAAAGPETAALSGEEVDHCVAYLKAFPPMEGRNLIGSVGSRSPRGMSESLPAAGLNMALIDCGVKANILRELSALGCDVRVFPADTDADAILEGKPDGVLISNGPGDPATLTKQIETVKALLNRVPLFGICLGHQLLALALGGETFKMKFGHHGVNHPVRDERTKKVFVTSQNHGFAVKPETLPPGSEIWFTNANDSSVEGIIHKEKRIMCVQFHPESAPGPDDSLWIFQSFIDALKGDIAEGE